MNRLTNELQKELFSKVYDLLMDSPRRLNHEDAEAALTEAWNKAFHRSLSPHKMITISYLEEHYKVLAIGATHKEAVENYCKNDDDIHSYKVKDVYRANENGFWYVIFELGADGDFLAKGIYTRGGCVMISYTHYTEVKKEPISELIRKTLIQWAYDQGWNKACLVDVLHEIPKGDSLSLVTFEVAHEIRVRYIAIIKKDWENSKVSIIEVKKA